MTDAVRHRCSDRLRRCSWPLILALMTGGCGSETTEPTLPEGFVEGILEAPGPVTAAVLQLQGVTDVSLENGLAFSRFEGGVLRVVLLLDQTGELRFLAHLQEGGSDAVGVVVEVADGSGQVPADPAGYSVRFGG